MKVSVVSFKSGSTAIYFDYQIVNGEVQVRRYDDENDHYYYESVPVEIETTFVIEILAKFIMSDRDEPCTVSKGMREINGLAYTYSVVILNNSYHGSFVLLEPLFTLCGADVTNYDMYSYHTFDENKKIVYNEELLVREVMSKISLEEILAKYL